MAIRSYRDLDAWHAAMDLALEVYRLAAQLPVTERFGLAAQLRRAAVSIPSNVAEGQGTGIFTRNRYHVRLALGSLAEVGTQLELARRTGNLAQTDIAAAEAQIERTGQLLHGIVRNLTRQIQASKRTKSKASERNKRTSERANERTSERANERTNERTSERTNERTNARLSRRLSTIAAD